MVDESEPIREIPRPSTNLVSEAFEPGEIGHAMEKMLAGMKQINGALGAKNNEAPYSHPLLTITTDGHLESAGKQKVPSLLEQKTGFKSNGDKIDRSGKPYQSYLPPPNENWENFDEVRVYPDEGRLVIQPSKPTNNFINAATKPGAGPFAKRYKEYKNHDSAPYTSIAVYPTASEETKVVIDLENPGVVVKRNPTTNKQIQALAYDNDADPSQLYISARVKQTGPDGFTLTRMENFWGYDENGAFSQIREATFKSNEPATIVSALRTDKTTIELHEFKWLADRVANVAELTSLWSAIKDNRLASNK